MEPLWKLSYLLKPSTLTLILTAVLVTFGSAFRAVNFSKEVEKNRLLSVSIFTMRRSHALMFPVLCSCSLITIFYILSNLSQMLAVLTLWTSLTCASSLYVCLFPSIYKLQIRHPYAFRLLHRALLAFCFGIMFTWLVSGNWILYNLLGISCCFVLVTHLRLPNVKVGLILLTCLFVYDVFWVFYSERFFGKNVMATVATSRATNPLYTIAECWGLPGLHLIKKELDLPGKLVFPDKMFIWVSDDSKSSGFILLGLGDMALPALLLALILSFDYRKTRDTVSLLDLASSKGQNYIWYAVSGYAIGLVAAMAAGILTHSGQPALLYLVPSTLGPVIVVSWMRRELKELWEWKASFPNPNGKTLASKE